MTDTVTDNEKVLLENQNNSSQYSIQVDNNQVLVKNKRLVEIAATISGSLTKFSIGMLLAWSSPAIPQLKAPDSPVPITSTEESWIIAMIQVGSFIGVLTMSLTVDIIGRKRGILLSAIPVLFSWILLTQATTPFMLIVGRFFGGLGSGYGSTVLGIYIGEIADPSIRGVLGTIMAIVFVLGIVFSYCLGPFVSVVTFAYISMAVPILLLVTFVWMPESPYFYLMRGKTEKARRSLTQLRGHTMVDNELDRMLQGMEKKLPITDCLKKLLFSESNRKPFIVCCVLFSAIHFTGEFSILAYCETIFENAKNIIPPYASSICVSFINLFAVIISIFSIDKCGRKPLLIISCIGMACTLSFLSIYFFVKDVLIWNTAYIDWIPLLSLIVYMIAYNLGLGNVAFIMVGELFPTDVKSVATCLTCMCLQISSIITIQLFTFLEVNFGMFAGFLLFAVSSVICTLFCYLYVPETKGKTLEEIQQFFRHT